MDIDQAALAFFNGLSGSLDVKLTEAPQQVSERLMNRVAPPGARLVGVTLRMKVYERAAKTFRELSPEEWERVVIRAPAIRLRGESPRVVDVAAPNGASFNVRELAAAVEQAEREGRGESEWLGGVDAHHTFFEGIRLGDDGVWAIGWGS